MRRTLLGSVIVWAAGGTALAADDPTVTILGIIPEPPVANILVPVVRGAAPDANTPMLPESSSLQTFVPPAPPVKASASAPVVPSTTAPTPTATAAQAEPTVATGQAGCNTCGNEADRFFGGVDYALFWMRRNTTPPLVQVLPASLANFQAGGSLPPGAAATVFGGDGIDGGSFNGIRAYAGAYLDNAKCWGIDGSYLQLFQKTDSFAIASPGIPVIGRGFDNTQSGESAFLRYSTPDGSTSGFINVNAPVEMYTFDVNIRAEGPSVLSDRVDYMTGFRYLNLRDSTVIDSGVKIISPNGGPPFTILSNESFKATNQFYGGQVGLETHYHYGCFSMELTGKFAVGSVHQQVEISGSSSTQVGTAPPQVFPNQSILYVQPTNAGSYSRDHVAILPEFMCTLGYQITSHLRATIGYDLLTVSSVERSGASIDPGVNPSMTKYIITTQTSNEHRPTFAFQGTDYWANGLTAGLTFTY